MPDTLSDIKSPLLTDIEPVFETANSVARPNAGGGGNGRPATPWEEVLDRLDLWNHPNQDLRLYVFPTLEKARARGVQIKTRINESRPMARLRTKARPMSLDEHGNPAEGTDWGTYVTFLGNHTETSYREHVAKKQARVEKYKATRTASESVTAPETDSSPVAPTPTSSAKPSAAERVKARAAARK